MLTSVDKASVVDYRAIVCGGGDGTVSMGSPNKPRFETPLAMLCSMFAGLDVDIVRDVYDRCGHNPSLAAELLLPLAEESLPGNIPIPISSDVPQKPPEPPKTTSSGPNMISRLSLDTLRTVAKFMSIIDICNFASVSRECRSLADSKLSGIAVLQNASAIRSWPDHRILQMFARFRGLTAVSLLKCRDFESFSSLPMALRDSPKLVSLNLGFCDQLCDTDVQLVVQGLPKLEVLDLSSTFIHDEALELMAQVQPPSLCRLVLDGCTEITHFGVRQVIRRCRKLRDLSLAATHIRASALVDATTLSHLYMPRCKALSNLSLDLSYTMLETLVLSACKNLKKVQLTLPALRCLNLSSSKQLDTLIVDAPALETLNLSGCSRLASANFHLPNLHQCNMYNCRSLLPGGLETLFQYSSGSLHRVDARGMIQLTDAQVERYVSACVRLEDINVVGCKALSRTTPARLQHTINQHRRQRQIEVESQQ